MSAMGTGFRHRREQAADRKCAIPSHLISTRPASWPHPTYRRGVREHLRHHRVLLGLGHLGHVRCLLRHRARRVPREVTRWAVGRRSLRRAVWLQISSRASRRHKATRLFLKKVRRRVTPVRTVRWGRWDAWLGVAWRRPRSA